MLIRSSLYFFISLFLNLIQSKTSGFLVEQTIYREAESTTKDLGFEIRILEISLISLGFSLLLYRMERRMINVHHRVTVRNNESALTLQPHIWPLLYTCCTKLISMTWQFTKLERLLFCPTHSSNSLSRSVLVHSSRLSSGITTCLLWLHCKL